MTKPRKLLSLAALSVFLALPAASAHASTDTTAPPDTVVLEAPAPGDTTPPPVIDGDNATVSVDALRDSDSLGAIELSAPIVGLVISQAIPLLLGLVFKYRPKAMPLAHIVVEAVKSLIVAGATADGGSHITLIAIGMTILGLATSKGAYDGLFKKLRLTNAPGGLFANHGI